MNLNNFTVFWPLPGEIKMRRSNFSKDMYGEGIKSSLQLDRLSGIRIQKTNSRTNQKGYDKSETTYGKLLTRKTHVQIFWTRFCVIHFWPFFFKIPFQISNIRTKMNSKELDSSCRILQYPGLRSFWGASICLGIDFFSFLRKSSWCGLDSRVLARTSGVVRNIHSLEIIKNSYLSGHTLDVGT